MKDICLIPAFNRPEYLFVTLSLLKNAEGAKDIKFVFALDYGHSKKTEEVIHELMQGWDYVVLLNDGKVTGQAKQSYNLLEGYRYCCKNTNGLIYLVEDDIFCSVGFFKAHKQIHAKHPELFCSIGSHLHNKDYVTRPQTMDRTTCQWAKDSIYQSWGVCFRKEVIEKYILPHAVLQYYKNPQRYVSTAFKHWLSSNYCEQDGLIRRACDLSSLAVGYPDYPRCYHAGIWSYHRQDKEAMKMNFEQRLKRIMDECFSPEIMKAKYNQYNDVFVSDLSCCEDIK